MGFVILYDQRDGAFVSCHPDGTLDVAEVTSPFLVARSDREITAAEWDADARAVREAAPVEQSTEAGSLDDAMNHIEVLRSLSQENAELRATNDELRDERDALRAVLDSHTGTGEPVSVATVLSGAPQPGDDAEAPQGWDSVPGGTDHLTTAIPEPAPDYVPEDAQEG